MLLIQDAGLKDTVDVHRVLDAQDASDLWRSELTEEEIPKDFKGHIHDYVHFTMHALKETVSPNAKIVCCEHVLVNETVLHELVIIIDSCRVTFTGRLMNEDNTLHVISDVFVGDHFEELEHPIVADFDAVVFPMLV